MVISQISKSQLSVMTMTEHERGAACLLILSEAAIVVASAFFISMLGLTAQRSGISPRVSDEIFASFFHASDMMPKIREAGA